MQGENKFILKTEINQQKKDHQKLIAWGQHKGSNIKECHLINVIRVTNGESKEVEHKLLKFIFDPPTKLCPFPLFSPFKSEYTYEPFNTLLKIIACSHQGLV